MALEVKKMKQGMSYSCKEKTIILNVFKYFRSQNPVLCVTEVVRRTAKATGCSEKSIFQFRKEEASAEGFKVPSTTKIRRNININSRDIKYDQNVRHGIKNIIYDLKYRNIVPSLSIILRHVNADQTLPNFSLMTLRRLLFDMGFSYEKNGTKSLLVEKPIVKKEVKGSKKKGVKREDQPVAPQVMVPQDPLHIEQPPLPPAPALPEQRFLPQSHHQLNMHVSHNVAPMMFSHRVPPHPHTVAPPPAMDMHVNIVKHEMMPHDWMGHHHHNMMK